MLEGSADEGVCGNFVRRCQDNLACAPIRRMTPVETGRLFHGDVLGCKAFLTEQSQHYVYILRRPDGRPFYVGKGYGPRVFQHENEARHPNSRVSNA